MRDLTRKKFIYNEKRVKNGNPAYQYVLFNSKSIGREQSKIQISMTIDFRRRQVVAEETMAITIIEGNSINDCEVITTKILNA